MSYVVKQKINGKVYLYEVVSYWDKDKKQPRQKRKYLGPEKQARNKKTSRKYDLEHICAQLTHKNYGNVYLLNHILETIGLKNLLKKIFPEDYRNIISIAFHSISTGEPFYLFPHWLCEQYFPESKILYSKDISSVCEKIGISQKSIAEFFENWINMQTSLKNIYYDITSISSYSTNNSFVEWGYNRDKDDLPQFNMGLMCSRETGMPLFYQIYPGSIVDVTTLVNSLKYMELYKLKNIMLVLDRGFCSKGNISELSNSNGNITFFQPLTFNLKAVRELLKSKRNKLKQPQNAFKYNDEILHYTDAVLELENIKYKAHIYYNEKADIDCRHHFLNKIFEVEKKLSTNKLASVADYLKYRRNHIPEKYIQFFKLNRKSMLIEKNQRAINKHLLTGGYFIILSNSEETEKNRILSYYRNRDIVEKLFDVEKNCMDGKRIRSHSKYNADGRIFIKFISLILYSYISRTMTKSKLFDKYSVRELIAELSKIKYTSIDKESCIISEISKAQKNILKAFDIDFSAIKHSY